MRASCRPSLGLTLYPSFPCPAMGWRQWHRASRFLPKSESKRVRVT